MTDANNLNEFDLDLTKELEEESLNDTTSGKDLNKIRNLKLENNKFKALIHWPLIVFVVVLGIYYVTHSVNQFFVLNGKDDALTVEESVKVAFVKGIMDTGKDLLGLDTGNEITAFTYNLNNFDNSGVSSDIDLFIKNSDISYITKKDALSTYVNSVFNRIKKDGSSIEKVKGDIIKFSFLPQDIDGIVSENEIQRAILAIESIKYFTALKTFSLLSSFKDPLSTKLGIPKDSIGSILDKIIVRGEGDTERYLSSCLLNPYEDENTCGLFGDFQKYYDGKLDKGIFDPERFINIMKLVNDDLEDTFIPKLLISLNTLDPKTNKISFNIEVNTFKNDEMTLLDSLNPDGTRRIVPHVFIITELINSLRKSHYIVGNEINLDSLEVNKKEIESGRGGSKDYVDNSSFSFNIPIQSSIEKEIYDYIYNN